MSRRDRIFYRRMLIGAAIGIPLTVLVVMLIPGELPALVSAMIGWGVGIVIILWAHEVFG